MTPGEFSNNLLLNLNRTYSPVPLTPPMFGGVTPVPRNDFANSILPPNTMGGWGAARQQANAGANSWLTNAQTVAGLTGRTGFDAAAGLAGRAVAGRYLGGILGSAAGPVGTVAGAFLGDALLGGTVESMMTMPFQPWIQQRQRALQLQNSSLGFVNRGPDMSAAGMGLTLNASMDLERQLVRMSGNTQFKMDTQNAFTKQDMMKLTHLASQTGLLDNAQSVDQIARNMGKISRALHTFMKIVEEPDVQQAMQMMGNMRRLGMSIPETNVAAANARVFARMAGTSVQGVMQAGMQGAGIYQQYGMSAASGLNAGMAATGAAGLLGTILDPRTLNMLGGREGIAQNLVGASARMTQIDAILPALLKAGKDGLSVDQSALLDLARGKRDITGLVQESARRMTGFGPKGFVNEYSTRQSELKDELMNSFGGQGALLAPMALARSIMQEQGVDFRGALSLMYPDDEKMRRTLEVAYRSKDFWSGLKEQQRLEPLHRQGQVAERRRQTDSAARTKAFRKLGVGAANALLSITGDETGRQATVEDIAKDLRYAGNRVDAFFQENFGEDTDLEEIQAATGGGAVIRTVRSGLRSADQLRQVREAIATPQGAESMRRRVRRLQKEVIEPGIAQEEAEGRRRAHRLFGGPDAFIGNLSGEYLRDTVLRNEGWVTRAKHALAIGGTPSDEYVNARARNMMDSGALLEDARATRYDVARTRRVAEATGLKGDDFNKAMGTASAAFSGYTKSILGEFGEQSGKFDMEGAKYKVREALLKQGSLKASDVDRLMKNPDFMKEVIATGEFTRSEGEQKIIDKAISAGAEVSGNIEARTRKLLVGSADAHRKNVLKYLGVYGDSASTDEKKTLLGIFGETGKKGEIRQKLLVAKALAAQGKNEQADQLIQEVKNSGISEKELAAEMDYVDGAKSTIDDATMRDVGKKFSDHFDAREFVFKRAREEATNVKTKEVGSALADRIGADAFAKYNEKGIEGLKEFINGSGKDRLGKLSKEETARILSGDMSETELERSAVDSLSSRADAVVADGLTQRTDAATNEVTDQLISTLSEAAKRDNERMEKTYGDFDKSVGTFDKASHTLLQAAEVMRDGKITEGLNRAAREAFTWGNEENR
jgi:hypothetical protein